MAVETRRLERFSLIGMVVAVLVLISVAYMSPTIVSEFRYMQGRWIMKAMKEKRTTILRELPDNDVRVDYDAGNASLDVLREGLKKFPNSPRLLLRYGCYCDDPSGEAALQKAAEIDTENAAPMYVLAAKAIRVKDYDKATALLTKGACRTRLDYYPIPEDLLHLDTYFERRMFPYNYLPGSSSLHALRVMTDYAKSLASQGRTSEAVRICEALQSMGTQGLRMQPCSLYMASDFSNMYTIGVDSEGRLHSNNPEWRQKWDESIYLLSALGYAQDLQNARAGISAVITAVWILLLAVCSFGVLASNLLRFHFTRRSKRKPASTFHDQATCEVFSTRGLARLYGWTILLPCVLQAIVIAYTWNQTASSPHWITGIVTTGVILLPTPTIVLIWAWKGYARAFEKSSRRKLPKTWKSGLDEDKRELHRRLSGVLGGGLTLLSACLLFSSLLITHRAPWNYAAIFPDVTQEDRIVQDIVQHKFYVPPSRIKAADH